MRLPQVRLQSWSLSALALPELFSRRLFWAYCSYAVLAFLFALVFTFPHELLIQYALRNLDRGPLALSVQSAGVSPFRGYELSGLQIGSTEEGQPPLLEFTNLWVRPLWSQWIRGNFYAAAIGAELYGGRAAGMLAYRDTGLSGNFSWEQLQLARYRTLQTQLEEGQVLGQVSGNIAFELRGNSFQQGQASGELAIEGLRLDRAKINGWPVPDIQLKQVKGKFRISPGKVDLTDLLASGDLIVQGSGQITLREPYSESALNLRLTVAPGPQATDTIKAVLALLPKPTGGRPDAPVTVSGTLARPRIR